jgi:transcriptional regulator with XRE-family HTH domain
MTQEQLAEKLGWERSVISKIETGERTCSVWEFMAICRALGEKPSKMMARMENW